MARAAWTDVVTQLCDFLQQNEQKIDCLRSIDKKLIDNSSLTELFRFAIENAVQILHLPRAHFYASLGDSLVLTETTAPKSSPLSFEANELLDTSIESNNNGEGTRFYKLPGKEISSLFVPVKNKDASVFGYLVFETDVPEVVNPLREEDKRSFASTLAGQLSLALTHKSQQDLHDRLSALILKFFNEDLKPSKCLQAITEHIPSFLPDYPTILKVSTEVQILLREEKTDFMTISGTTERGSGDRPVLIAITRSVCGLLFENETLPYVLCNPERDYPNRYKSYLGKKIGRKIQTELAVPVTHGTERFAVINLESPDKDAFKEPHIRAILQAAEELSHILWAFKSRSKRTATYQLAAIGALDTYLGEVAGQYLHTTKAPFSAISLQLDELKESFGDDDNIRENIKSLRSLFDDLKISAERFCKNVSGFSIFEPRSVKTLIQDALSLHKPDKLADKRDIRIAFDAPEDYWVDSSLFLMEIFYNIIDNAKYWIGIRQMEESGHKGEIRITLSSLAAPDADQEVELNRFCRVEFCDNGLGVSKDNLEHLLEPGFHLRRDGTGFGLSSAKEYISTLGGYISLDSEPNQFFLVRIDLRRTFTGDSRRTVIPSPLS